MPDFVYSQYDERLTQRIRKWLGQWCKRPELVPKGICGIHSLVLNQLGHLTDP